MFLDLIQNFLIAWVLSTNSFIFIFHSRVFKRSSHIEKVIAGLSLSLGLYVVLGSWGIYIFQQRVNIVLKILIFLSSISSLIWTLSYFTHTTKDTCKKILKSKSSLYKSLLFLIFILLFKLLLLLYFRPVVDSDVINLYLPYARGLVESGQLLEKDLYSSSPMMIPPIGGPLIFASSYIASKSITSEVFRMISFPFLFGICLILYKISKRIFDTNTSLLSVILFLSLPVIDSIIFDWALYPDVMYVFLITNIFYMVTSKKLKANSMLEKIIIGLAIGASILLKSQGILPAILLLTAYVFKEIKNKKLITNILLIVFISSFGGVWFLRNYHLYKGITNPSMMDYQVGFSQINQNHITKVRESMGIVNNIKYESTAWVSILTLSVFGTFYFIPKIVGIISALRNKKVKYLLIYSLIIYIFNIAYFGYANQRYLFAIVPQISILIIYGIDLIIKKISNKNHFKIKAQIVLLIGIFSLSQSLYLARTVGSLFFTKEEVRNIVFSDKNSSLSNHDNNNFLKIDAKKITTEILKSLNIKNSIMSQKDIRTLFILGLIISSGSIGVAYLFRNKKMSDKKLSRIIQFSSIIFISPYIAVMIIMSGGELNKYSENLEYELFDYWGQNTQVLAALGEVSKNQKILKFGPMSGLSYKIGVPVINLWKNYSRAKYSNLFEMDQKKLEKFIDEENIDFIVLYQEDESYNLENFLSKERSILGVINNDQIYRSVLKPSEKNRWTVLKSIK